MYVPLTTIGGTSSLHLESTPGAEDWHPIEGEYGTTVKRFAGAICAHWTTENKTTKTRVSFDFRMIPGPLFQVLKCGGNIPGGQIDVYRKESGYYSSCVQDENGIWTREGHLLRPDSRVGYPWTVKNWEKVLRQREKKKQAAAATKAAAAKRMMRMRENDEN